MALITGLTSKPNQSYSVPTATGSPLVNPNKPISVQGLASPIDVPAGTPQGTINKTGGFEPAGSKKEPSEIGQKIATLLSKTRQDYPNMDDAILKKFVTDNAHAHPDIIAKLQPLLGSGIGNRTTRNNNPTALTTDVAASLGMAEGTDYVQGDPFKDNQGHILYTAKIKGDGFGTTVSAFDKAAASGTPIFTTKSGKPRWTYINMTNQQWEALSPDQKLAVVKNMNKHEGTMGSGASGYSASQILDKLIQDNTPAPHTPKIGENGPIQSLGKIASAAGNFVAGTVKGTGYLLDAPARHLTGQGENPDFVPEGDAQKFGFATGKYVLPTIAGAGLAGAGLEALPAIGTSGQMSLIQDSLLDQIKGIPAKVLKSPTARKALGGLVRGLIINKIAPNSPMGQSIIEGFLSELVI